MASISYQVVFNKNLDFKNALSLLLKESFEDFYNAQFIEENITSLIEIKYSKELGEEKSIVGFEISYDETDTQMSEVIKGFNERLNENEDISVAFKFHDEKLFYSLDEIHSELFEIEMKLREIISLIFVDTYQGNYYDLLNEIDVRKFDGKKNLEKDDSQRKQFLQKRLENEFFHISFSDYSNLLELKTLKQNDLYGIAENSNDFDEFRAKIINRGVRKTEYQTFINNIKSIMNNLEKIRNCVAHNRTPSSDELDNYRRSADEIKEEIDKFFDGLKSVCPKCGGKIKSTQQYIGGGFDEPPSEMYYRVGCEDCDYELHSETIVI